MSVRLNSIYLYSHQGHIRPLNFNRNGLSVITGKSKTGKSAIIDVVDYCLGRHNCYVAEGVIRQKVSWFAIEIENDGEQVLIARKNPGPSIETSLEIFIRRGTFIDPPPLSEIAKNITLEALVRFLTRFSGIAENETRPIFGTRRPLQATIRHALFLCFQKQDEIDNRDRLFHRQGEDFIPQAIKDTLPYFLGAVDEDQFVRQHELDLARDELRGLENAVAQRAAFRRGSQNTLNRLLNEGKRVGIIDATFAAVNEAAALAELGRASTIELTSPEYVPDFGETVERLRNDQNALRDSLTQKTEEIRVARIFQSDQSAFSREAVEQKSRLECLNLFKGDADDAGTTCPLCDSHLSTQTPSVEALRTSLQQLDQQLAIVYSESPQLQQHIVNLEKQRATLEQRLVEAQGALTRALVEDARAQAEQDMLLDRARTVGRIGSFLENLQPTEGESVIQSEIELARQRVSALEAIVASEESAQRLDTYLNLVSSKMGDYSKRLDLEHGTGALRLDLRRLTVVADTETGPIPLYRMGSGENWVGYHVLTYLALHWWFRRRNRPVPGFVFFDQPSQAHYPADRDQEGRLDPLADEDRTAVRSLFKLMDDASQEIGDSFQLIVLDHAHLDEEWFEGAIVEEWRNQAALIPSDW